MWKKLLSLIVLAMSLFTFVSCSNDATNSSAVKIKNGSYLLTPKEYIDFINQNVENMGDSRYLKIPDYVESGETIDIDFIYCSLKITEDGNGNISNIAYYWDGKRSDIGYSIGLYCSATFDYFSGGQIDEIFNKLDIMNLSVNQYETTCINNGSLYSYKKMGEFNWLTISPEQK